MKVALVSAEAFPFSKTGGLGDVVGSLFKELLKAKQDVALFLPYYRSTREKFGSKLANCNLVYGVPIGKGMKFGAVLSAKASVDSNQNLQLEPTERGNVFFIEHNDYFDRDQIYGTQYGEYFDNAERFIFFSRAFLEVCRGLNFGFNVVHCHDWHTALIPLYLKTLYKECLCFERAKSVLTIHNLGYQGVFPRETLELTGFGWEMFHIDSLEFYGMVNFLKGGIFDADLVTTVSPTYAKEIMSPEFGFGLHGVLKKRENWLRGIVNGIDYDLWNPERDPYIVKNYSKENLEDKILNKEYLLKTASLDGTSNDPLFGFIGRMVAQKGIDILVDSVGHLVERGGRIVFVGTGEAYFEDKVRQLMDWFPRKVTAYITYSEELAHRVYAGVDALILPSKYEPCGLSQLIAMRYGTIPICRKTGGLADTVEDSVTGFLFNDFSSQALKSAIDRFIEVYHDRERLRKMSFQGMSRDFSWSKVIKDYIKLYEEAITL